MSKKSRNDVCGLSSRSKRAAIPRTNFVHMKNSIGSPLIYFAFVLFIDLVQFFFCVVCRLGRSSIVRAENTQSTLSTHILEDVRYSISSEGFPCVVCVLVRDSRACAWYLCRFFGGLVDVRYFLSCILWPSAKFARYRYREENYPKKELCCFLSCHCRWRQPDFFFCHH